MAVPERVALSTIRSKYTLKILPLQSSYIYSSPSQLYEIVAEYSVKVIGSPNPLIISNK